MFTSTHFNLAKLAVEANVIDPALKVFDKDITNFPNMPGAKDPRPLCDTTLNPSAYISSSTGLTGQIRSSSILEYNLLRAIAYMSRRDWPKAHVALEQAITHPTKERGVSKLMLDAHKRWVLVGLLSSGASHSLPSYTSSQAKSSYNSLNSAYIEVASLFSTSSASQFLQEIQANQKTWEDDGNRSLVREVMAAYQKWQIINLRHIYTEVPIPQVRKLTRSGETGEELKDNGEVVALIRSMIDGGFLKGSLQLEDGAEGYLKFEDDSDPVSETAFAAQIAYSHQRITALSQQYKLANERLSGNKEYVKHVVREQKRAEKDGPDAGIGFDSQVEDEDLMTGIMSHG
jgi:COP9 signalosome complex subunit 3